MNTDRRNVWSYNRRAAAPLKECECGCGELIPSICRDGKPRRFAIGHSTKKERPNEWGSRRRARKIKGPGGCELEHIGGCGAARIEVHHLDANPYNNHPSNLMRLCASHHKLVEHGRIDLANPVMPLFVVSGGTRRYEYQHPWVVRRHRPYDS